MKKMLLFIVLSTLVLGFGMVCQAGKGDSVDMGKYTCGDLIRESPEDIGYVLMWVDGYLSSETGDLKMDEEWIQEMATTIKEECSKSQDTRLIDIVKKMSESE